MHYWLLDTTNVVPKGQFLSFSLVVWTIIVLAAMGLVIYFVVRSRKRKKS